MAEHVVRWSMTATHAEVLRTLPPELAPAHGVQGRRMGGSWGHRTWELELLAGEPLRVGTLELTVTQLVIRLVHYSEDERDAFLARLERYTRRGGG